MSISLRKLRCLFLKCLFLSRKETSTNKNITRAATLAFWSRLDESADFRRHVYTKYQFIKYLKSVGSQSFCLGCSEQVSSKLNYYFRKMKLLSVIVLLFGVVAISAIETEENVLILTDENFDSAVADNKYILVEFCKFPFVFIFKAVVLNIILFY